MSTRLYYAILLLTAVSMFLLGIAWEFWLEDRVVPVFNPQHATEPSAERWEYVASTSVFSVLALIVPALLGRKLLLKQEIANSELVRLAETDYLTGLYNRGKANRILEQEIARHRRYGHGLSIILLDIDYFKKTNDTHGHPEGDRLLKSIAARIAATVRDVDIVSRWGGEEFIVICPATGLDGARQLAEKLRMAIESAPFGELGSKTASCGVAAMGAETGLAVLMKRADDALYAAKNAGRNRVVVQD